MANKTILRGTLILLAAGLFTRVLGFFYRLALSRIIGAQGMGLIQMVIPVLVLGVSIATAGIPVAVSKMVAERVAQGRRREIGPILRAALALAMGAAALFALALLTLAKPIADNLLPDPRAHLSLLFLVPAIIAISISAVFRGYFQGLQQMTAPAGAQIVEQLVRLAAVFLILPFFLPLGSGYAAAGAVAGLTAGEVAGLAVLLLFYHAKPPRAAFSVPAAKFNPNPSDPSPHATWEIISVSLPITVTRLVSSLAEILDVVIIPRRLEAAGFSRDQSTAFFGVLSGMAVPLIFFPTVLTFSLSSALVPAIAEAAALNDLETVKRRSAQALHFTILIGLPVSTTFLILGHPLGLLFYGSRQVGDFLRILALASPFLYLEQTLTAVFRGLGLATVPMLNSLAGSALRLAVIYFGTLTFGVQTVLWAVVFDLTLCFALNYRSLGKHLGVLPGMFRNAAAALVASAVLGLVLQIVYRRFLPLGQLPACLLAMGIGGIAYLLGIWFSGTMPPLGVFKK